MGVVHACALLGVGRVSEGSKVLAQSFVSTSHSVYSLAVLGLQKDTISAGDGRLFAMNRHDQAVPCRKYPRSSSVFERFFSNICILGSGVPLELLR